MNNKVYSYLGICQKAGKLISGEGACEKAIASGDGKLIIIAQDASDNTKKKFLNKAEYYHVPVYIKGERDILSSAIGKINRPTVVITDKGLSEKIIELLIEDIV